MQFITLNYFDHCPKYVSQTRLYSSHFHPMNEEIQYILAKLDANTKKIHLLNKVTLRVSATSLKTEGYITDRSLSS
uniref:Uncharacterized protein n=1 Tax=Anguilla anguilla TaxID=7936 RepID=A0A0E9WX42_ANGAN